LNKKGERGYKQEKADSSINPPRQENRATINSSFIYQQKLQEMAHSPSKQAKN
jgi:hypothetical protein